MFKLAPLLIAVLYGLAMYRFSAWNTKRMLDQKSSRLADPTLEQMNRDMAQALEIDQIKVHIYEVEPVNGLAAWVLQQIQGGRGHRPRARLRSVIAHELGHVALGHSRRRMIDFSGQNAIRLVLGTILGRLIPFAGMWLANLLTSMLAARLSRQDEYEADAYASALLTKAGIGTGPQKALFRKLEKLSGAKGAQPLAWMMSHPNTADRIAAIEANEAKWGVTR